MVLDDSAVEDEEQVEGVMVLDDSAVEDEEPVELDEPETGTQFDIGAELTLTPDCVPLFLMLYSTQPSPRDICMDVTMAFRGWLTENLVVKLPLGQETPLLHVSLVPSVEQVTPGKSLRILQFGPVHVN